MYFILCIVYFFTQRRGGGGERLTREKVRGVIVNKAGSKMET
jgi:hypothetical protein